MLIWSGFGLLAPLILIGSMIFSSLIIHTLSMFSLFNDSTYLLLDVFGTILSWGLAGLICIRVGGSLNNKSEKRYIDQETGEQVILKRKHTFFFVKIEKWGIVYIVFGVLSLIATVAAFMC